MKTAIIILNYNSAERTVSLVEKISAFSCPEHVVVVDNCSTDGSFEKLKVRLKGRADLVQNSSNSGYAKGNRLGAAYALRKYDPDVIFIANPDVSFDEPTALSMARTLMDNEEFGVCAPLVDSGYNVWELPGYAGIIMSLFLISFTLHKKRIRKQLLRRAASAVKASAQAASGDGLKKIPDNPEASDPAVSDPEIPNPAVPAQVVEGSFFAIRRDAYLSSGGFDRRTFLYAEEIMLASRLKKAGYRECVLPFSSYSHLHSESIRKAHGSSKVRTFKYFHESFRLYNKYYLHTNALQDAAYEFFALLALLERYLYDFAYHFLR